MSENILQALYDDYTDSDQGKSLFDFNQIHVESIKNTGKKVYSMKIFDYDCAMEYAAGQIEKESFFRGMLCMYEFLTGKECIREVVAV